MKSDVEKQIEAAKQLIELAELQSRLPYSSSNPPIESPRKYGTFEDVKDEDADEIHRISPTLTVGRASESTQSQTRDNSHAGGKPRGMSKSQLCARDVAKLDEELHHIRRSLEVPEEDYEKLKAAHPLYLTFKAVKESPILRAKILALGERKGRLIGLAQELAGIIHKRAHNTVKADWKRCKPASYRQSN